MVPVLTDSHRRPGPAGASSNKEVGLYPLCPPRHIALVEDGGSGRCAGSQERVRVGSCVQQLQQLSLVCENHSRGLKALLWIKAASNAEWGGFQGLSRQVNQDS